jgi:acyl-CoA thioesterase I
MNALPAHSRIVFVGDSITACGKSPELPGTLGAGYVGLFSDLARIRRPQTRYEIVNSGIDGNTIGHLLSRWADDVLSHQPDIVVTLIGINDAVRLFENMSSYHLPPDKFRDTYRLLITETQRLLPNARLLPAEPFYLTTRQNPAGSYRNDLADLVDQYAAAVRDVCEESGLQCCRTNSVFARILIHSPIGFLSTDGIHLTRTGHLALAEAVYDSLFGHHAHV